MLDLAPARVGAEWIGRARVFRNEVKAVDVAMDKALAIISAPLRARLQRHPKLRTAMLADTARRHTELVPPQFRIGAIEGARHKIEFAVVETRLCVSWLKCDEWTDPEQREPGVTICKFTFSVHDGRLRQRWSPMVNVSMHALARHEERRPQRSDAALWQDLVRLAGAGDEGERVETPHGFWLGGVIEAGDANRAIRMRSVRRWLNTDG